MSSLLPHRVTTTTLLAPGSVSQSPPRNLAAVGRRAIRSPSRWRRPRPSCRAEPRPQTPSRTCRSSFLPPSQAGLAHDPTLSGNRARRKSCYEPWAGTAPAYRDGGTARLLLCRNAVRSLPRVARGRGKRPLASLACKVADSNRRQLPFADIRPRTFSAPPQRHDDEEEAAPAEDLLRGDATRRWAVAPPRS
jgi:hypothetical protein